MYVRSLSGGSWRSRGRPRDYRDSYSRSRPTCCLSNNPNIPRSLSLNKQTRLGLPSRTRLQLRGAKFPSSSSSSKVRLRRARKVHRTTKRRAGTSKPTRLQPRTGLEFHSYSTVLETGPKHPRYLSSPRRTGAGSPSCSRARRTGAGSRSLSPNRSFRQGQAADLAHAGIRTPGLSSPPRRRGKPVRSFPQNLRAPPPTLSQSER
ncbi:hypothetical protein NFI96_008525 [Prochilodus magdalenae]|nr:hypothetical protein NFI96_008525 [Prochilodus magdalenae]